MITNKQSTTKQNQCGIASVLVLILGMTTMLVMGAVVVMVGVDYTRSSRNQYVDQAMTIAEAGVNYYRWHLAHNSTDYHDGTGLPGPYVHEFKDPQGAVVGYYSLEITPPNPGYTAVTIKSTGWTTEAPNVKRAVTVQYGLPSVARYSFLHNAHVWFGQGLTVHGRVLSNGGIRQDGINDSIISSARDTYTCGTETGCSPPATRNGVWGSGGPSALWDFPVPPMDFDGFAVDFNQMRTAAQANGTYFGATSDPGYHLDFQSNGTVNIYRVTDTSRYRGYDTDTGCTNLYQRINNQSYIGNFVLDDELIFFFEDTVWVEGEVDGKATVVAARFPIDTYHEDMWVKDSITYTAKDGNHALGLIAQRNIYLAKDVPNNFEINAALLAHSGKIIRHHYGLGSCTSYANAVRTHMEIYGSVISGLKSYWNWGSGPSSGFQTRDVWYDPHLRLNPPPYFPTSGDFEVVSWEESAP